MLLRSVSASKEKQGSSNDSLFPPFPSIFHYLLSWCLSVSLPLCAKAYSHRETAGLCPLGEAGREGGSEKRWGRGGSGGEEAQIWDVQKQREGRGVSVVSHGNDGR